MRIAAAVIEDGDRIVPLPDSPTVVILDTETLQTERHPNPGHPLTQNRRAATTEFLHAHGVSLVCAVPLTFCPASQDKARSYGMRFVLVPEGTTWNDVVRQQMWNGEQTVDRIPDDDLFRLRL